MTRAPRTVGLESFSLERILVLYSERSPEYVLRMPQLDSVWLYV